MCVCVCLPVCVSVWTGHSYYINRHGDCDNIVTYARRVTATKYVFLRPLIIRRIRQHESTGGGRCADGRPACLRTRIRTH